jgi:hypothetical protein
MSEVLRTILMCVVIAGAGGCVGRLEDGPLPLDASAIAIVGATPEARRDLGGVTGHRGEGMAVGAAGGTLLWLDACAQSTGGDSSGMSGALCLLFTPVATVGGGLYGLAMADGADVVAPRREVAEAVLDDFRSDAVAEALGARLGRFRDVDITVGPSTPTARGLVLEVDDVRVVTKGVSVDSTMRLHISARLRARNGDGRVLRERVFERTSGQRTLAGWVEGDPPLLELARDDLVHGLANDVAEAWFLRSAVDLEPLEPVGGGAFGPARVATLTPEFSWRLTGPGRAEVGEDVEYVLRIRGADGFATRVELTDARWGMATPLAACSDFEWILAARWQRYGEWRSRTVDGRHMRFRTPCE